MGARHVIMTASKRASTADREEPGERFLAAASAGSCAFENGAKICLELGLHGATDQLAAESYAQ